MEAVRTMKFLIAGLVLALSTGSVAAQESTNRVAQKTAWSVFVEDSPTQCWAVAAPKETVNTRDGRVVAVRRSDILFYVTYQPGAQVADQVSFTGGYPFAPGSSVELTIGDSKFELFTQAENAWPASPADDRKIITAMKRGATATVVGRSSRGTRTEDTFSLLGFTAAVEDAEKRCGS